jgi:hypothetical protein
MATTVVRSIKSTIGRINFNEHPEHGDAGAGRPASLRAAFLDWVCGPTAGLDGWRVDEDEIRVDLEYGRD